MDPAGPEQRPTLPTGPHPTAGPSTIAMPSWPGPLMAIVGGGLAVIALGVMGLVIEGQLTVETPAVFTWAAIAGALLFAAGFLYIAIRQVRVRRFLPPERYRGPAVLVLLVLGLAIGVVLTVPFASDTEALILGRGELSLLGATVILVSTQAGLLLVTWLFVFRPRALAALPSFIGPDVRRAIGSGIGWGVLAWFGAMAVSAVVVLVLESVGVTPEPQAAEQAIASVEPWLVVVAIVILAPIAEEVFFRGVVYNAWLRERGPRWAFIGSSALFAVIHASLVAVLPILLLGMVLAWIYRRTGSLLAPIFLHATFNGMSVALALLVRFDVVRIPI